MKITNCEFNGQKLNAEVGASREAPDYTPEAMAAFQVYARASGMHLDDVSAATSTINGKTVTDFEPAGGPDGSDVQARAR